MTKLNDLYALINGMPQDDEELAPVFRPQTMGLCLRKTRRYVDSYRHLDTEQHIGTVTVMQRSEQRTDSEDDPDPCEPTRIMMLVEVKPKQTNHALPLLDVETLRTALKDTFTHWGCGHERDCCGCWNTMVTDAVPLRADEELPKHWVVIQSSSRNY